jgi:hypothetical protein
MNSNAAPESAPAAFTPDQLRALGRFDLKALIKDLSRRHMAIHAALDIHGDGTRAALPHLVRMEAEAQIIDWIVSATRVSLERSTLARLTPESIRAVMERLRRRHSTAIWDSRRRLTGKGPTESQLRDGPSDEILDQYMREELHVSLPAKNLSSTLGPTCDSIDSGKRQGTSMAPKHLARIFQALGESADLVAVRQLQVDQVSDRLLQDVTTAANTMLEPASGHVGLFPLNYGGRYALKMYADLLQNPQFSGRSITIRLCEAERMYLVDCVNTTPPVHPTQCATMHRLVDDLHGSWPFQEAMPGLSLDLFKRWCLACRQTGRHRVAPKTAAADNTAAAAGYDLDTYLPTAGLPVPPIGGGVLLEHWVHQRLHQVMSASEAQQIVAALFAEDGDHGIEVQLSHDDAAVLSEVLVQRTLLPPLPLPEMAMVACLLGKVGLPWLPPAGPPIPLHVRGVSASLVLGAADLLPPPSAG